MDTTRQALAISVLTVTRRCHMLRRCLGTIATQDYGGEIEHIIVADDQPQIDEAIGAVNSDGRSVVVNIPRAADEVDGPARLARLRNHAVSLASHDLIVFLDDDNTWDTGHLASLYRTLVTAAADLAHSERLLFENDGRPYLRPEYPWARSLHQRRLVYEHYVDVGIMARGSNRFRDRMGMAYSCVDLGAWLFRRELLRANPFDAGYSLSDWQAIVVEDRKLSEAIVRCGVRVASTGNPTLHYYLGGYSNNFAANALIYWARPG